MRSIWQATARQELQQRLVQLRPEDQPRWGKMNCPQMLAHVTDALRMAGGEMKVAPKSGPLRYWPLKQLIIYSLPWPKGAPTAPELLARQAEDIEQEKADLTAVLDRLSQQPECTEGVKHPAFGTLTQKDWGRLMYRHMDHHFKQFGV